MPVGKSESNTPSRMQSHRRLAPAPRSPPPKALTSSPLLPQDGAHLCAERLPSQHLQCREARQAPGADPSCVQGHREVLAADDEARCAARRLIAPNAHTCLIAYGLAQPAFLRTSMWPMACSCCVCRWAAGRVARACLGDVTVVRWGRAVSSRRLTSAAAPCCCVRRLWPGVLE